MSVKIDTGLPAEVWRAIENGEICRSKAVDSVRRWDSFLRWFRERVTQSGVRMSDLAKLDRDLLKFIAGLGDLVARAQLRFPELVEEGDEPRPATTCASAAIAPSTTCLRAAGGALGATGEGRSS